MTRNTGPDSPQHDTANPADALPARTTPTWEIEILLSGASVFALFQLYDSLQRRLFDIFERLSPEALGMWTALGGYVQAGVLALALGFVAHLLIRAYWAAAVGLHSIDPAGTLGRSGTVGPVQREMLAERWANLPQRIASLDDHATLVFAMSLGLAKVMALLVLFALVGVMVGFSLAAISGGRIDANRAMLLTLSLAIAPAMIATIIDNRRGKKDLPPLAWTRYALRPYALLGLSADSNLGLQMMVHRVSGGRQSMKGTAFVMVLMTALLALVTVAPVLQRTGLGALLKGDFPSLEAGQFHTLRASHYVDRLRPGQALQVPAITSEIAKPPYLRLFIPYVPHWHDALLRECRNEGDAADAARPPDAADAALRAEKPEAWRHDALASAATLRCLAEAMPVALDGRAVRELWVFSDDRRTDRRGFVVMIDVRSLPAGRHELQVTPPDAAFGNDEPRVPWRIPFWL
jgi:hypothetical protein